MAPRNGTPGFSLVELLLAAVILAVGLLGMLGIFSVSSFDLTKSGGALRATALAQERIEALRNLSATALIGLDTQTTAPPTTPADTQETVTVSGRNYTVRTWIAKTDVQVSPPLRRFDVTVIVTGSVWPETRGYRLDSIIGRGSSE